MGSFSKLDVTRQRRHVGEAAVAWNGNLLSEKLRRESVLSLAKTHKVLQLALVKV